MESQWWLQPGSTGHEIVLDAYSPATAATTTLSTPSTSNAKANSYTTNQQQQQLHGLCQSATVQPAANDVHSAAAAADSTSSDAATTTWRILS
jgi:hypothetical protein